MYVCEEQYKYKDELNNINNISHGKGKGSIAKQNCVGSFQGP